MKNMTISTGVITNESNLPKGRQVFINDENNRDLAVIFNWEKDEKKFEEREEELKKLANLYTASSDMYEALKLMVNAYKGFNGAGNIESGTPLHIAMIALNKADGISDTLCWK